MNSADNYMQAFMDKNSTYTLHTGSKIPIMGLGTWNLNINPVETISYALQIGYRLIDTSSDYGTQEDIGRAVKQSKVKREDIYVTTKVEENDDAYKRTKSNLLELQMDFVDLMLIHRPPSTGAGEGLWEGLVRARDEGLVKDIGVSNYSPELIDKLIESSRQVPVVNQIEWSPFGYSQEMVDYCGERQILIQAYSPVTREQRLDNPTIKEIAEKYSKSSAQVLIRWSLQLGACPIPKANQKEHLEENINVFDFEISNGDMGKLSSLNEGFSTFGVPLPY